MVPQNSKRHLGDVEPSHPTFLNVEQSCSNGTSANVDLMNPQQLYHKAVVRSRVHVEQEFLDFSGIFCLRAHGMFYIMSSEQKILQHSAPKVRAQEIRVGGKHNWYLKNKDAQRKAAWKQAKSDNKNKCRKRVPQKGLEIYNDLLESLTDLALFAGVDTSDALIRSAEGLLALFINIKDSTSYAQFTSGIFLYARDKCDTSVTKQIMQYLQNLFDNPTMEEQVGDESEFATEPNWLRGLRDMQNNWELLKNNKAFKQISKLLGILVTLGLCDAAKIQFSLGGFQIFDEAIVTKHMTAHDLADALFGTVAYFAEGAFLCFQHKSFQPLLLNDFKVLELDNEYNTIVSWWDLFINGNLERVHNVSDSEFSHRLNDVTIKLQSLANTLKGLDKKLVMDKLQRCKIMQNDLITRKICSGTRRSPFAIELYGESNQGKTTFGDQLLDALLTSANLPTDKSFRAAINPSDKYMSNWTSDKLVAILDDVANDKANFVSTPPTRTIIDICNNQMYYAAKADLESKGKCFMEPEIALVTTNVKHLCAGVYSECPYSIQRRMDLVMTVKCKPRFQRYDKGKPCGVDATKVREYYTVDGKYDPPSIDDIWTITVQRAVQPNKIHEVAGYAHMHWRGRVLAEVPASVAIQFAIEKFHEHRNNQYALMDSMRKRAKALEKCPSEGCVHLKGYCPDHDPVSPACAPCVPTSKQMEKQVGLQTAVALHTIYSRVKRKFYGDTMSFTDQLENMVTRTLYKKTSNFLRRWDWICVLPSDWVKSDTFASIMFWFCQDDVETRTTKLTWTTSTLLLFLCYFHIPTGILAFLFSITFGTIYTKTRSKEIMIDELRRRNNNLPDVVKGAREKYARGICEISLILGSLYMISKVYSSWRRLREKQDGIVLNSKGTLDGSNIENIRLRDEEPNAWAPVVRRDLPSQEASKTTSFNRLCALVEKNLVHIRMQDAKDTCSTEGEGPISMANALMLDSNMMLLPDHYFDHCNDLLVECRKVNADAIGGRFTGRITKSFSYRIPGKDLRVCYLTTGGSFRDLRKFLPLEDVDTHPFKIMWRFKSGDMLRAKGKAEPGITSHGSYSFPGLDYTNLSCNTFSGMCGAVLVSETKAPMITGFHVGGVQGRPVGCACTITFEEAKAAFDHIRSLEGTLKTGSGNDFKNEVLGQQILKQGALHPKSPLNYLPEGSQFEYYGKSDEAITSRSDVHKTPISDYVTTVTGVENIWGKPKMKPEWYGWQKALANGSKPAGPFSNDLMDKAVRDYKRPLIDMAQKDEWQSLPLSDEDNINGIPGCKFIDSINMATSVGFPLKGAKLKHVVDLEPTERHPVRRDFTPEIWKEIHRVEGKYAVGERAYTIAKACKKDEVLPVAKEKCRIFYGNPISLTFLIRKYYLPIIRMLQMNPLLSECAVGINCHGPEWETMYSHVMHFGDNVFGGDYGKYDQKLSSQSLIAALRILNDLGKVMGYSQRDLDIMESMAGDIVYSLISVNGDLIGLLEGMHISGNSLTVILNGICGSLNLRCFFYSIYRCGLSFRAVAHMITYGDDNIGTVHPDYSEFNIKACSEFLAQYGQIYTMPDKESALQPYLQTQDFEFLKRKSVYHESIGKHLGALDEKSIFKSLHCYIRGKKHPLTPKEACALNIDTALREWFNHGEAVYAMRRSQMEMIAKMADITHMCSTLDWTYEDRVVEWKEKYGDAIILQDE